ncbi:MAG TPA: GNAT family N-acetyltransferase [Steroidobacteraceae bacterium]|jgi:phosphinothricin acetyltransferase|nr:GNAT family N-acetyltransferase [Steroidobacteraceae bacterium]
MKLVDCEPRRHAAPILEIFNEAIANSTALYDYQLRTPDSMVSWFAGKAQKRYPVIGLENAAGDLLGFATFGMFRERPAYKYTVEHSIYIDTRYRGQGHGRTLLEAIVAAAVKQDYHVMVGGIDASNAVSIKLHQSLGFTHCGTVAQAGFKFGRWLDLAFYQKILATPAAPVDG